MSWKSSYAVLVYVLCQGLAPGLTRYPRGMTGSCSFPDFVWTTTPDTTERIWFTETRYPSNDLTWESRRKITAQERAIAYHVEYPWTCETETSSVNSSSCIKNDLMYTLQCMRSEDLNTYRVAKRGQGVTRFMCLKFVRRNPNILQIWRSHLSNTNEGDLCGADRLVRDEWPWVADTPSWEPCPYAGGYDFVAHVNGRKKPLCHRVWRPSRLEAECIQGEGLRFFFPERSCSFFQTRVLDSRLYCLGSWHEDGHVHVLAGEQGHQPRYVLRYPELEETDQLVVDFLFSPVCLGTKGLVAKGNIMHVLLDMHRSEPGTCYDESPACSKFPEERKCRDGNLHHYGNHCKRSCGLCDLVASEEPECEFPLTYRGSWILFDRNRNQHVTITSGEMQFSQLGKFVCKAKHWSRDMYKFLSVYENGCRPRYTCMEFEHSDDLSCLQFKMSSSSSVDRSFNVCDFKTDQGLSTRGTIHAQTKILHPVSRVTLSSCGLGGLVHLQASFPTGKTCQGSLSDWDPFSCAFSASLAMSFHRCTDGRVHVPREFTCDAFVELSNGLRLLLTRENLQDQDTTYQCWLISMTSTNNTGVPSYWTRASVLDRARCHLADGMKAIFYQPAQAIFQVRTEPTERHCLEINTGPSSHSPTIRYSVRKAADQRKSHKRVHTEYSTQTSGTAVVHGVHRHLTVFLVYLQWRLK